MSFSLDTIQCQSSPLNNYLIILTKSIIKKYGIVIPVHSPVTREDLLPLGYYHACIGVGMVQLTILTEPKC